MFPSPCSVGSPLSYHTIVHQHSKMVLGNGMAEGRYDGDTQMGVSAIGFETPLTRKWAENPWVPSEYFGETEIPSYNVPEDVGELRNTYAGQGGFYQSNTYPFNVRAHAICVNLRAEMSASAQERTMMEVTHCCGTMDYRKGEDYVVGYDNDAEQKWDTNLAESGFGNNMRHDMTCLTVKGMILIFCEYIKAGIIPAGINLAKRDLYGEFVHPTPKHWLNKRLAVREVTG